MNCKQVFDCKNASNAPNGVAVDTYQACNHKHLLLILLRETHSRMIASQHEDWTPKDLASTTVGEFVDRLEKYIDMLTDDVRHLAGVESCDEDESDLEYDLCGICLVGHEIACTNRDIDIVAMDYRLTNQSSKAGSESCVALYLLTVDLAADIGDLASALGKPTLGRSKFSGDVTYAELEAAFV